MDDIYDYLKEKFLPEDDATAEWIARQSKRYAMVDGDLYRCDTDGVFLRCISREEGGELLADIHKGECGSHSSSRTMLTVVKYQNQPSTPAAFLNISLPNLVIGHMANQFHEFW